MVYGSHDPASAPGAAASVLSLGLQALCSLHCQAGRGVQAMHVLLRAGFQDSSDPSPTAFSFCTL